MQLRHFVSTNLRRLARHGQVVTSACTVVVNLQKGSGILAKVGAFTAIATLAGNFIKTTPVSDFLEQCTQIDLPGVNLGGLLVTVETRLPAGYDWAPSDWKACMYAGKLIVIHKNDSNTVYVHGDVSVAAHVIETLRNDLWQRHGNAILVETHGKYSTSLTVEASHEELGRPGPRAEQIWRRLKPWIVAGRPRSLIVDGRPGTGKSTAVKWIIEQIGGRMVRIPISGMMYIRPSALVNIVNLLKPDVVVIDDFDRTSSHSGLLDMIVTVRGMVKLLVATTNNISQVTTAAVRPRRFDEVETIDSFDRDFVAQYLGTCWEALSEKDRDTVANWPMAYLEDLRERHELMTDIVLADEVAGLECRLTKRVAAAWEHASAPDAATPKT